MADTEEPQYTTLAERIAALNKNKTFAANGAPSPAGKPARPPPPPPPNRTPSGIGAVNGAKGKNGVNGTKPSTPAIPARPNKANPPPLPRRDTQTSMNGQEASRPQLPARQPSSQQPPTLPQRKNSSQPNGHLDVRRNSSSSEVSQNSTRSSKSTGQSSWSTNSQASTTTASRKLPSVQPQEAPKPAPTPNLPPRLPARTNKQDATPAKPRIMGFGSSQSADPPKQPNRPKTNDEPPPIPTSTRPSAAQIQAVVSRPAPKAPDTNTCFTCQDWSAPDALAAQYPRQSVPRNDPVGYLAHNLCSPFPSYNDKARAIFTWCHHNIAYDVGAFFGNNVQHATGESTIFSGLAVCAGYAETYKAIANRAGLECDVVGGHGKGFGYTPLKEGESPPPPDPSGHAWNAVRIDGGGWKLLDACWGAGNVDGATQSYNKAFNPAEFTISNEEFGARHFPEKPKHQHREDGRTITWDEYYRGKATGEPVQTYCHMSKEGIKTSSVEPANKHINVYSGAVVRFQFCKVCPHWTSEKNGHGKPPLLVLKIGGVDGRKEDMVPIQTDGYWHWLDVNARDLGAPGQKVEVLQITEVDHKDARGLSAKDFLAARGRKAMAFSFLAQWVLR